MHKRLRFARAGITSGTCLIAVLAGLFAEPAWAHVKWFVNYNLADPPRTVMRVITGTYFPWFCVVVVPVMFAIALLDRYLTRRECLLHRHAHRLTEQASPYFPLVLRLGVSAFFGAVFVYGCLGRSMILTPELQTHQEW